MKKILGTTLAAALLIPGPANAEILKNLKVNGQLDIQSTAARNANDFQTRANVTAAGTAGGQDRIGTVGTRLLVDATWDLLDDVHSVVTLRKNDRAWGSAGGLGQAAAGSQAVGAGGIQANTFVDRANITIDKLFGHVDTTLGRQYYGDAGDLIVYYGMKDTYGLWNTAIDAARFELANDWMAFSGLAGKTAGGTFAPATADTNVRGFDILWKSLPLKVHTFIWNRVTQGANALGTAPTNAAAATGLNDNLWVYGVKLRGEAMGGWINADIAANGGEDRTTLAGTGCGTAGCNANTANYIGKALLLDAGYNAEISGVGALTPWVNFGYGTGRSSNLESSNENFTSIASDYRPGIMNRRFAGAAGIGALNLGAGTGTGIGTNGLGNRVVYGTGLNVTPAAWEKLTVGAQLWHFNQQRTTATNALLAAGTERGAKHLGAEYGVTADWKHSENVKVGMGGSIYAPGGFVKQTIRNAGVGVGNNPATLLFADFTVKF
jgi:hypothetical protein